MREVQVHIVCECEEPETITVMCADDIDMNYIVDRLRQQLSHHRILSVEVKEITDGVQPVN